MGTQWSEFTTKDKPADTDELMELDTTASANKRVKFSGIWDWIVDKMATAVMSKLETQNKTLIGAVNELNSNQVKSKVLENMVYASDLNIVDRRKNMWCFYYFNNTETLNRPDDWSAGIMILYTNVDSSEYGGEYAFCNGDIYGRKLKAGEYGAWKQIF